MDPLRGRAGGPAQGLRGPDESSGSIVDWLGGLRREGRERLDEAEGKELLGRLAIGVPRGVVLRGKAKVDVGVLDPLPGPRVLVKGLSPQLVHKTELGALETARKEPVEVAAAIGRIAKRMRLAGIPPTGFLVEEEVPTASELLVGLHWSREMGPVLALGPGGTAAEQIDGHLRESSGTAFLSPSVRRPIGEILGGRWLEAPLLRPLRSIGPLTIPARLEELVASLFELARGAMPADLLEIEVNPMGVRGGELVALDAVVRLGTGERPEPRRRRSRSALHRLYAPRSVAVVGVSERRNPGRVLLENLIAAGTPADRVVVVRPSAGTGSRIEGCRVVSSLQELAEPVDLCVVALGAEASVAVVEELAESGRARTVLLVAGGIGEGESGRELASRLAVALESARRERGPDGLLLHGPNCLGLRSRPDGLDTSFVPSRKREAASEEGRFAPWALISQSGAFALSRSAAWAGRSPRYEVTVGNQADLTIGDHLLWMADDPGVRLAAVYAEGLADLDGPAILEGIQAFARTGRPVVLYRAGRSRVGIEAGASHTAALAGERRVVVETARAAGALVAETLEEFEDLVRVLVALEGRSVGSGRVGLVSNAGFECVAMADRLRELRPGSFGADTRRRIEGILADGRLDGVVTVRNPLDLTPMTGDAGFAAAVEAVLDDSEVDVAIVGCVPYTEALRTLSGETFSEKDRPIAARLVEMASHPTPWLAVVDAGPQYSEMTGVLAAAGVPVFRTGDRATAALDRAVGWRLRWGRAG